MTSTIEIEPILDNNSQKTNQVLNLIGDTIFDSLKTGGINHQNILNVFSKICKELEFNKNIKNQILSDTGGEKAILAIKIIHLTLQKYSNNFSNTIDEKEKQILDFFLSSEGELILLATTSIIVKTFNHIYESYQYADVDDDGCICGAIECKRFWKRLFCCIKSNKKKTK